MSIFEVYSQQAADRMVVVYFFIYVVIKQKRCEAFQLEFLNIKQRHGQNKLYYVWFSLQSLWCYLKLLARFNFAYCRTQNLCFYFFKQFNNQHS